MQSWDHPAAWLEYRGDKSLFCPSGQDIEEGFTEGKTLRQKYDGNSRLAVPTGVVGMSQGLRPALYAERGSPFSELPLKRQVKLLGRNRDVWVCPPSREVFLNLTEQ